MDNREEKSIHNIEVYIGGSAALFAISAVLYKASINGFSQEAVLDALISISEQLFPLWFCWWQSAVLFVIWEARIHLTMF